MSESPVGANADRLSEHLVGRLNAWRLGTPALAFLLAHRPLAFVTGQALLVLQPLLDGVVSRDITTEWAALLGDRDRLTHLIRRLESGNGNGRAG